MLFIFINFDHLFLEYCVGDVKMILFLFIAGIP